MGVPEIIDYVLAEDSNCGAVRIRHHRPLHESRIYRSPSHVRGCRTTFRPRPFLSVDNPVQAPAVGDTLQLVLAGCQTGSDDPGVMGTSVRSEPSTFMTYRSFDWASQPAHAIHDPSGDQVGTTPQFPLTDVTLSTLRIVPLSLGPGDSIEPSREAGRWSRHRRCR